jgi:hypothetical protein
MMPPWLPHTRLQDKQQSRETSAQQPTAEDESNQAVYGLFRLAGLFLQKSTSPACASAFAVQSSTARAYAFLNTSTLPGRLCVFLCHSCDVLKVPQASSLLLLLLLLQHSRQVLLLLLPVASSCKNWLQGRSPPLLRSESPKPACSLQSSGAAYGAGALTTYGRPCHTPWGGCSTLPRAPFCVD